MKEISVYKGQTVDSSIDQIPLQRDWMDFTFDRHAYHCFPLSLANRLGWGISFPEDISFIWDGINDPTNTHVKILSGEKYAHSNRGNRTISFNTGISLKTSEENNASILTMPVPNQFIDGAQCMTTIISTSVLPAEFPVAWMITKANEVITIPANTPVAAFFPISLTDIQDYEMVLRPAQEMYTKEYVDHLTKNGDASQEKNQKGIWTHFYRDALDYLGNKVGKHETKKIILRTRNVNEKN
jgi:Family of unknown function (DUF6065)